MRLKNEDLNFATEMEGRTAEGLTSLKMKARSRLTIITEGSWRYLAKFLSEA